MTVITSEMVEVSTNPLRRIFQNIYWYRNEERLDEVFRTMTFERWGPQYLVERVPYGALQVGDLVAGENPLLFLARITQIESIPRKRVYKRIHEEKLPLHIVDGDDKTLIRIAPSYCACYDYHIKNQYCWKVIQVLD